MAWIPDHSHFAYVTAAPFVRAVGWLSREHPYPSGDVPPEFVARLAEIARRAGTSEFAYGFGHFMGFHVCELCPPEATRQQDGVIRNAGAHNFAVPFAHLLFVCPELIAHYVRDHGYRPPEEFITAVLETALPEPTSSVLFEADALKGGASVAERLASLYEAVDATDYGRVAATFRARFATLHRLDGAVVAAAARAWTVKGQCPGCDRWSYGQGSTGACCGLPLVHVETRRIDAPRPAIVVVMGVSCAGKSTVGELLAERKSWTFREADDFYSPATVAQLRRGEALTDADRGPWLDELHALLADAAASGRSLVLACSSLTAQDRRRLIAGVPGVCVILLRVSRDELDRRLRARGGQTPVPPPLDIQLAAIEDPDGAIVVEGAAAPEAIVATVVERLDCR